MLHILALLVVQVRDCSKSEIYILLEARLSALYKEESEYEILEHFLGKSLFGKGYQPLFPYYSQVIYHQ